MFKFLKSLNTATKITLARIAILPLILFFYISPILFDVTFFENWGKLIALILFVIAAATDFLDGYIARKYNQVTNTGKLLDPVADKMLTTLGFILILSDPALWGNPAFPYWYAVLVVFIALGRDIVTNSLRFIAAEQGITIAADRIGKTKSLFQFIGITLYMLFAFNLNPFVEFIYSGTIWYDIFAYTCMFIMTIATILSVWSGVNYVMNYAKSNKESKEKKDGQPEN